MGALVKRHGIVEPSRLVIVHDELDLEPGQVRLKSGGGIAGHNGLASIANQLGTQDFTRLRIGIGKPPRPEAGNTASRHGEGAFRGVLVEELANGHCVIAILAKPLGEKRRRASFG